MEVLTSEEKNLKKEEERGGNGQQKGVEIFTYILVCAPSDERCYMLGGEIEGEKEC